MKAVHLNGHNRAGAFRQVARLEPDLAGLCEAQHRSRQLARVKGMDYFTGPKTPGRNMTQETGILLASDRPNLGHTYAHLSDEWPPADRVAPERWGQVVVTRDQDVEVAAIELHPVAGPQILTDRAQQDHPLVLRYALAADWLHATIAMHHRLGREVVIMSDAQLPRTVRVPWSLHHVIDGWGFDSYSPGIDVIAWSTGYDLASSRHFGVGSDHPLLSVELRRTQRRHKVWGVSSSN